jgi:hypothetical protein
MFLFHQQIFAMSETKQQETNRQSYIWNCQSNSEQSDISRKLHEISCVMKLHKGFLYVTKFLKDFTYIKMFHEVLIRHKHSLRFLL